MQVLLLPTEEEVVNVSGCLRLTVMSLDVMTAYHRLGDKQQTSVSPVQGLENWTMAADRWGLVKAPFWSLGDCLLPWPCWEEQALVSPKTPVLSGTPSP